MLNDNQMIRIRHDLPEHHIRKGTIGVVVMVYPTRFNPDLLQAYEVEFTDDEGTTLAMGTLREDEIESIEPLKKSEK